MQAGAASLSHFQWVEGAGSGSVCIPNSNLHAVRHFWGAALAFCVPLDVIAIGLGLLAGLHLQGGSLIGLSIGRSRAVNDLSAL